MTLNSRGNRRACDQCPIVINRDPLVCDRDDDLERALRSVPGLSFLRQFRFCMPVVVLVPERSVIAPPRPVLRPKRKLGVCVPHRKYENGKGCHDRRADGSHIVRPETGAGMVRSRHPSAVLSSSLSSATRYNRPFSPSRDRLSDELPSGQDDLASGQQALSWSPAPDLRCTCRRSRWLWMQAASDRFRGAAKTCGSVPYRPPYRPQIFRWQHWSREAVGPSVQACAHRPGPDRDAAVCRQPRWCRQTLSRRRRMAAA